MIHHPDAPRMRSARAVVSAPPGSPAAPVRRARVNRALAATVVVAVLAWTAWPWHREAGARAAASPAPDAAAIVASVGRRASHGGRYHAEVVSATPFAVGVRQSWTMRLTRRGQRRVSGARLTVRPWAPESGEISPISPSVRYVGGGRYRVDDIYFPRPGWWNVALVIDGAAGTDSVAFNVVMPAPPVQVDVITRGEDRRRSPEP